MKGSSNSATCFTIDKTDHDLVGLAHVTDVDLTPC